MKRLLRLFSLTAALGVALFIVAFRLSGTASVQAGSNIYCVNSTGTGCDAVCGGGCFASVQAAIDAAAPDAEIRIAGGTYTAASGTVAVITQSLSLIGGYAPDFGASNPDPDAYPTVLDAQWTGSVISITNAGDVILRNLRLVHGDGTGNCGNYGCGGGIYAAGTHLIVENCVITGNVANKKGLVGMGGGIYAYARGYHVEVRDSQIVSNTANTDPSSSNYSGGGGIFVYYGRAFLVRNRISDNVGSTAGTGGRGGGIFLHDVTQANVLTNTIRGNEATAHKSCGDGGGMYIFGSKAYVAGNLIENNWTAPNWAGDGGGVLIHDSEVHLDRNTIIGNATLPPGAGWAARGGGVYIASSEPVTLTNNLIARNAACNNGGGGVYVNRITPPSGSVLLVNNTIADNGDTGVGASMYATLALTNDIIAGHAKGLLTNQPFTGTVTADHNLFWNTTDPLTGTHAILEDPLLDARYHLRSGSPAIDAGLTIPWLTTDLEGFPRPQGGGYDIGAFEGVRRAVFLPLVVRNR